MTLSKAEAGRLGAAVRHGHARSEQGRRAELRARVLAVLTDEPQSLADLARRAGVSRAGTRDALNRLSARRRSRAEFTEGGWRWKA